MEVCRQGRARTPNQDADFLPNITELIAYGQIFIGAIPQPTGPVSPPSNAVRAAEDDSPADLTPERRTWHRRRSIRPTASPQPTVICPGLEEGRK
jgi:hypothetical protein